MGGRGKFLVNSNIFFLAYLNILKTNCDLFILLRIYVSNKCNIYVNQDIVKKILPIMMFHLKTLENITTLNCDKVQH